MNSRRPITLLLTSSEPKKGLLPYSDLRGDAGSERNCLIPGLRQCRPMWGPASMNCPKFYSVQFTKFRFSKVEKRNFWQFCLVVEVETANIDKRDVRPFVTICEPSIHRGQNHPKYAKGCKFIRQDRAQKRSKRQAG